MHGRLKVKTTAEQQEAKRKERAKKLVQYQAGTQAAFKKRENKEYDREALDVTGQLLAVNPDFYSLWNFRREILQHMKDTLSADEYQKLVGGELQFLEGCLRINPKSYGSWHHRGWVLDSAPSPDWKKELQLCNTYLEYDERNFHCWDYRRFVVKRSNVPAKDEFEFTTTKISSNFSNFSSWHYRSKLLPVLHPDPQNWVGVREEQLSNEFELAQNAFFTDPNDQSAWFYHKWLLGKGQQPLDILSISASRQPLQITVTLTQTACVGRDCQLSLRLNQTNLQGSWRSLSGEQFARVWVFTLHPVTLHSESEVTVEMSAPGLEISRSCTLHESCDLAVWRKPHERGSLFKSQLSASTSEILEQELEACQQLHEMEPDNKWTLLTILSLMRALHPLQYENDTLGYLDKLITVDPMRTKYYEDLRSKYLIENALEIWPTDSMSLSLSGLRLSCLCHLDHMTTLTTLDLSNNSLSMLEGLGLLQCLRVLNLESNFVDSCEGLELLQQLEELSLKNNFVRDSSGLEPLQHCKKLRCLALEGNPVTSKEDAGVTLNVMLRNISIS